MNILFVCSRNQWRSRTAEDLFKTRGEHAVRSAGTAPSARIRISEKTVDWADLILVMEKRHKQQIQQRFGSLLDEKNIRVLDIPDEYGYMDPALVDILESTWRVMMEGCTKSWQVRYFVDLINDWDAWLCSWPYGCLIEC